MTNKIELKDKLNFLEIDLTDPCVVVNEILSQLPDQTDDIILGKIERYSGPVETYTKKRANLAALVSGTSGDEEVDIQRHLGRFGISDYKYECYIYPRVFEHFRFRLFLMQHSDANYPVRLVIEETVAKSSLGYTETYCATRDDFENTVVKILTSKRTVQLLQEMIRVHQIKSKERGKVEPALDENEADTDAE